MARLTFPSAWLCCLLVAACSGAENPLPDAVVGTAPPIGIACSTLVDDGFTLDGSTLLVEGEAASCSSAGMVCPLAQDPSSIAAAECDPGEVVQARCSADSTWHLGCRAPLDAGVAGAGGQPGAGGSGG